MVFANNDSAHHAALDLHRCGAAVSASIDVRPEPSGPAFDAAIAAGIRVHAGHGVLRALGGNGAREAGLGSSPPLLPPDIERAGMIDMPMSQSGVTAFHPPGMPVALGTIAGPGTGIAVDPLRRTAMAGWHGDNGAVNREVRAVRSGVGLFDDGTVTCLGEGHYLMTTTEANAEAVMSRLEYLLQVEWPDLDVYLTSVTDHWAAMALAGPRSRTVLERVADIDVSDA